MKRLILSTLAVFAMLTFPWVGQAQVGPSTGSGTLQLTLEQALEIALSESNTIKIADMTVEKTGYAQKGSYAAPTSVPYRSR